MQSAATLVTLLREGRLTCRETTQKYLSRIENTRHTLNAVAEIDPTALDQARLLDETGDRSLPLFGLPVLIKDNIDVKGLHTTAGSMALRDNIAFQDAPVVANLRRNGAVILGKTNMTEFANYTTAGMPNGFSSRGGQVVNAYSPAMDPGGSSTGSAVAVSAGLCAAAVGTDTLFSVVGCATHNGVAGIKPAHGSLSGEGIVPICHTLDSAGPLARTLGDAILIYSAMRGSPMPRITPTPAHRLRIAVSTTGRENVSPDQLSRYDAVLASLRAAGASVCESEHPFSRCYKEIMRCEFRHDLEKYLADSSAALKTLPEIIGFYESNPQHMPHGITLLTDALENASGRMDDPPYLEAMALRESLRTRLDRLLDGFDACLMTGSSGIFHLCGLPSVALPMCMAEDGTPRGMILYGRDEQALFSAALTIEAHCPGVVSPATI